jgi:hypothetical protein
VTYPLYDPAADGDDRDFADIPREEQEARVREMSKEDVVELLFMAAREIDRLTATIRTVKRELAKINLGLGSF